MFTSAIGIGHLTLKIHGKTSSKTVKPQKNVSSTEEVETTRAWTGFKSNQKGEFVASWGLQDVESLHYEIIVSRQIRWGESTSS